MSEENTETVRFTPDLKNPPTLTTAQQDRLDAMRDDDIDLSDIPDHGGREGWTRPGSMREAMTKRAADVGSSSSAQVSTDVVRLEADVISFFRESGGVSDGRINAVLREYMQTHRKSA